MRLILIDNHSGFIFADSADLTMTQDVTPESVIDALHDSIKEERHPHVETNVHPRDSDATGYWVYRADINGSEAVPVVHDGQNSEAIEAVERDCLCLGFWARVRKVSS